MTKVIVCPLTELPPRTRRLVTINGRDIAIFNVDGDLYALKNRCPHQGGSLCAGRIVGNLTAERPGEYEYMPGRRLLRCPWHGWEFDLATGQSWFDPHGTRVRPYDVKVESGSELGEVGLRPGPYVAEPFRVSVEAEYIVIEV